MPEVHRGSLDRQDFACRHVGRVGWSVAVGVDIEHLVFAVRHWLPVQVEVRMVRHVNDGFLVGGGCVAYVDGIVIGQGIGNGGFYRPREAVVLVRRDKSELYCVSVELLSVINLVLPAREPAMQTMSIVVPGEAGWSRFLF